MIKKVSPKCLWDHIIDPEALIRSHTAHSAYELDSEVPDTRMNRQTSDRIKICEYEWYQWVMLPDQNINYPYPPVVLEWYLGPAIDVDSTMTYKTLKRNGEYVCRTNVPPLILTEIAYTDNKEQQKDFDTSVEEDLVPRSTISYFDASDLTPELENYVDNEDSI